MINAFGALRPDQPIHVFTKASRWLLDRTITVPVTIVEQAVDSGAIQRDSLHLDIPATLAAAAQFEAGADDAAVALAREFRARQVQVAVCDAPPMPCTAAHLAGVPAIVLANFTWDWIFEDFIAEHPAFAELPARLGVRYARADAAWRLPMHGGFGTVRTVLDFPWIARRSRRDRAELRRLIGADDDAPAGAHLVRGLRSREHDARASRRRALPVGALGGPSTARPTHRLTRCISIVSVSTRWGCATKTWSRPSTSSHPSPATASCPSAWPTGRRSSTRTVDASANTR